MNDKLKIVVVAAIALIAGVYLYVYFSPYQTCIRGVKSSGRSDHQANLICAEKFGGRQ